LDQPRDLDPHIFHQDDTLILGSARREKERDMNVIASSAGTNHAKSLTLGRKTADESGEYSYWPLSRQKAHEVNKLALP
jgi:hypothetical protein